MRDNFFTANPPGIFACGRIGHELIDQVADEDQLANGKPWNGYNRKGASLLIKHPFGNLVRAAVRLTNQKITNTVMDKISDDHDSPTDQRVERIFDLRFECQKPGTMIPAPTRGAVHGRESPRSSRHVSSTTSSPTRG